jgi:hypothetical protein
LVSMGGGLGCCRFDKPRLGSGHSLKIAEQLPVLRCRLS